MALVGECIRRRIDVIGAARSGSRHTVDVRNRPMIASLFRETNPTVVINAAAMADVQSCEDDACGAWLVNSRSVAFLAEECRATGARLVQISSDHFYSGDGDAAHDEAAPVRLVNEYARTKLAGEAFALTLPDALIIRTNFTGWRGWADRPTFVEWAVDALARRQPMTLFDDYFTSTIEANSLSSAILDLVELRASSIVNVACREVISKKAFVAKLAARLGFDLTKATNGSVKSLRVPRAESAGLDVRKAEAILGRKLPDLEAVVEALVIGKPASGSSAS
jgi:dTDP-4-dehydrorhamnose reductase